MATKCTYCDQDALSVAYVQPPMCGKHQDLAIIIGMIRNRGLEPTLERIRIIVSRYPRRVHVRLDEVDMLAAPMLAKEAVLDGEHV